jgi:hypothetical protein
MYIGGNFSPHVMKSAEKLKCMQNIIDDMILFGLMRSGKGTGRFSAKGQKCMPVLGLEGVQYV